MGAGSASTDAELDRLLREMDPATSAVLDDPELRDLVWPAIRSDYDLTHAYGPDILPPLDCDVLALGGEEDDWVDNDMLTAWGDCTTAAFERRLFPGGHFYFQDRESEVLRVLSDSLAPAALERSTP